MIAMPLKAKNTRKYSNPISAREIGDTCAMIRPKAQLVKGVPAGAGSNWKISAGYT
jgi:hypothetical protein